jgi:uncharacterized protein with GYD domain
MLTFITQARWTSSAIQGLVARPEDRYEEVRGLFERAGCRLVSYYVTFGEHDFLIVSEAPDATALFSVVATAVAGGGVTDVRTVLALSTAEAKAGFEAAGNNASKFRSAGQA